MANLLLKKLLQVLNPQAKRERAQTMVEFALVFPLVLLIIFGIVEFGRVIFLYAQVVTASREAARFGSASGGTAGTIPHYQDCAGIRDAARRSAILVLIPDGNVTISYDRLNTATNTFNTYSATCPPPQSVLLGDRIIVQVQADFEPLLGLVNIPPFTVQSITRRTILRNIEMGEGGASGGTNTPPVVTFGAAYQEASEAAGTVLVQVMLTSDTTVDVEVPYAVTGSASDGADYSITNFGTIIIPAGDVSADINVTIIDDDIDEPNEDIVLTMGTPVNATKGSPDVHSLWIMDNDDPPEVYFEDSASLAYEPTDDITTTMAIAVVMTGRSSQPIDVSFDFTGSADEGTDFTISSSPFTIPALATGWNIIVFPIGEIPGLDEDDEKVEITLRSVSSNAVLGWPRTHTLTIQDTDDPPKVYFTQGEQTAPEGLTVPVVAQLSAITTKEVRIPLSYTGTAIRDIDYVPNGLDDSTAAELVILPGTFEATLELRLVQDNVDEIPETVIVTMGTPLDNTATLEEPNFHRLTIGAVSQPSVFFEQTLQDRNEGTGQVDIIVRLSNAWTQPVTINFALDASSTASSGTDFSLLTSSPIVIPVGQTSGTIRVDVLTDVFFEQDETVVIRINSVTNATLGFPYIHVLNILDDDSLPTVQFTVTESSVYEHEGTATIQVQLSAPSSQVVNVPFSIRPTSSATLGATQDYTYTPINTLTIPAGATSASIQVTVYNDTDNDPRGEVDENVQFLLSSPPNAELGANSSHVLTILEDDLCPVSYAIVAAGAKVTVSFNYYDTDSPLAIRAARIDFQTSNVAEKLSDVYQNNTQIFRSPSGALTGSYIQIPDTGAGYNWLSTPLINTINTMEFVFKKSLVSGYEVTLSLAFNPGCSRILWFTP